MSMPRDFQIERNVVVITGGFLKDRNWVLRNILQVEDTEFIRMSKGDRTLARAFGLDVNQRAPWELNRFIDDMIAKRNDAVDSFITDSMKEADPSADCTSFDIVGQRPAKFQDAEVPQIISVTWPGFTANNGERWPATDVKLLSTPRRDAVLTIELSNHVLAWLLAVVPTCETAKRRKQTHDDVHSMPKLSPPNVRWIKKGGHWRIACSYKDESGKYVMKMKTPAPFDDPVMWGKSVETTAYEVQAMFNKFAKQPADEEEWTIGEEIELEPTTPAMSADASPR